MPSHTSFTSRDEAAIRSLLDRYAVHVLEGDWTASVQYFTDDAIRMPPNEPTMRGKEEFLSWLTALPPVTGFTLTTHDVSGDGDLACARGGFTFDLAPRDARPINMVGKWQAVYQRQADGSWRCFSDIWNTDEPVLI